jgi:hypothetical protein
MGWFESIEKLDRVKTACCAQAKTQPAQPGIEHDPPVVEGKRRILAQNGLTWQLSPG